MVLLIAFGVRRAGCRKICTLAFFYCLPKWTTLSCNWCAV
jgi:hypothetical protein